MWHSNTSYIQWPILIPTAGVPRSESLVRTTALAQHIVLCEERLPGLLQDHLGGNDSAAPVLVAQLGHLSCSFLHLRRTGSQQDLDQDVAELSPPRPPGFLRHLVSPSADAQQFCPPSEVERVHPHGEHNLRYPGTSSRQRRQPSSYTRMRRTHLAVSRKLLAPP